MVNSGTEAAMSAIRVERFTGRDKIIKFEGCYHGHADGLLLKQALCLNLGVPDSPGVPRLCKNTISLPFNDLKILEGVLKRIKNIACIILEPVVENIGCVLPKPGFEGVRRLTKIRYSLNI